MAAKIKRSMTVHPHPVVRTDGGFVRFPTDRENPRGDWGRGWARKWDGEWGYKISRVTNSVAYRPGLPVGTEEAQRLINDGWTVTVLA